MHQHFANDPDMERLILDITIVRVHPCAAGASINGEQAAQALGRSRGGFSTKIHVRVDALGNPLRFELTGGQCHDITQAEILIAAYEFNYLIADKSYDADPFLELVSQRGAVPVVRPRTDSKRARDYDAYLYRERHLVECFFNKIKYYRRIFSRFDKLDSRYLGFLSFVGSLI